ATFPLHLSAPSAGQRGPSGRGPRGALRSLAFWSARPWPSCVAASPSLPASVPFAGKRSLRPPSGGSVTSRRRVLTGFVIALAPLGGAADAQEYKAQPAGKVYRVGVLLPGGLLIRNSTFHQELRERGYVEGQNLILEERGAEHHYERLPELATELVKANVDI